MVGAELSAQNGIHRIVRGIQKYKQAESLSQEMKMGRRLKLTPQADFIQRMAQASPIDAVEELIWNGLDERAKSVTVQLKKTALDDIKEVTITDNGNSLPFEHAEEAFSSLGNSRKQNRVLEHGQTQHGRLGQGRHKAFSLGQQVIWKFTYQRQSGEKYCYSVEGTAGVNEPFYLTDEVSAKADAAIGCVVTIKKITRKLITLLHPKTHRELTGRLAHFLLANASQTVIFDGKPIRPKDVIASTRRIRTHVVIEGDKGFPVTIQLVEWTAGYTNRDAFLCGNSGIPLHRLADSFLSSSDERSVFIKSPLFDQWHDENLLQSIEGSTDSDRKSVIQTIKKSVRKDHQKHRAKNAQDMLSRLREEGSYPYRREPVTEIETIERNVFDVCAINIGRHMPNFEDGMDVVSRKLMLRMIREAISQNPSTVGKIIREVCKLPSADAKKFSDLLDDIPLTKLVDAAHRVAQRLEFLKAFKSIIYLDDFEEKIRERTQLQRILADNLWLFGEEYAMGTDDQDIQCVLEKHISLLKRDSIQPEMSEKEVASLLKQLKRNSKGKEESLSRIPDFMIWKQFKERRADEYEFLVIEIKRPGVPIGHDEHRQIEAYARAVMNSGFANKEKSSWVFIVVSDELTEEIDDRARQENLPRYTTSRPKGERYEIRAMPWNAIIQSAEGRHDHLRDWLSHNVAADTALKRAKEKYDDLLPKLAVARRIPKKASPKK